MYIFTHNGIPIYCSENLDKLKSKIIEYLIIKDKGINMIFIPEEDIKFYDNGDIYIHPSWSEDYNYFATFGHKIYKVEVLKV